MSTQHGWMRLVLTLTVSGLLSAVASASDVALAVAAENGAGSGQIEISYDDCAYDATTGTYTWEPDGLIEITDGRSGDPIATLYGAIVEFNASKIEMTCNTLAGPLEVQFVLRPLPIATQRVTGARATATVSVADFNGDGARVLGTGTPGSGAFKAYYNGAGAAGTKFVELVAWVQVGPYATASVTQSYPSTGYFDIAANVLDFSGAVDFRLTPGDFATVTARYELDQTACPGDLDGDSIVDLTDFTLLSAGWGVGPEGDVDGDGNTDFTDFSILVANWGCGL